MGVLKPEPKTRQRALLAAWGIDEMTVTADGIQEEGIWILGAEPLPDAWHAIKGSLAASEVPRTLYAYPSTAACDDMMEARAADWTDYLASLRHAGEATA